MLPEECKQELVEIISWMKYKEAVYERGDFDQKVSLGKGLIAIFSGQTGTGKTIAAEVIEARVIALQALYYLYSLLLTA